MTKMTIVLFGMLLVLGSLTNIQTFGAELKRNACLLNAIVKYNECHKDATAFFDVHKGRIMTEEDSLDDMEHTQTCMIEAFKIICISIEARKCSKVDQNKILDTVKQFAFLRFHHCSGQEIMDLSTRIIEYAKENNVIVATEQSNDINNYEIV